MKRAMVMVKMADAAVRDGMLERIEAPPEPWYVQGPRGGVYRATGMVRRLGPGHVGADFMRGVQSVAFQSEGARYLRPGTAAHSEAVKLLNRRKA